jgi:hypothetical protein
MDDDPLIRAIGRAWAEREFVPRALNALISHVGARGRWPAAWLNWDGTPAEVLDPESAWPTVDNLRGKAIPTIDQLGAEDDAERLLFAQRINEEARRRYLYLVHKWLARRARNKAIRDFAFTVTAGGAAWYFGGSWIYVAIVWFVTVLFRVLSLALEELHALRLEVYQLHRHVDSTTPDLDEYFMRSTAWIDDRRDVPGYDNIRGQALMDNEVLGEPVTAVEQRLTKRIVKGRVP